MGSPRPRPDSQAMSSSSGPRPSVRRRLAGFTFLELLVLLAVLGVLLPPLSALGIEVRDRAAVRQALEDASALLTRGRWLAVTSGGSSVEFRADPPSGWALDRVGDTVLIRRFGEQGVELELSRGRPGAVIRFGPLGLGMVSSQTLTFSRGDQRQALVVSGLGRVRRSE